jgi:hypothetical protein
MPKPTVALSLAAALLALVALITGCGAATATRTVTTYRTTTASHTSAPKPRAVRCTNVALAAAACGTLAQQYAARVALDPQNYTASTTTTSAGSIDCQQDGMGNGTPDGAGCQYTMNDPPPWCGSVVPYQVVSPAGTFLVDSGYEGNGLEFFRWSDGTETARDARVC